VPPPLPLRLLVVLPLWVVPPVPPLVLPLVPPVLPDAHKLSKNNLKLY
jgi:hypothetical protein